MDLTNKHKWVKEARLNKNYIWYDSIYSVRGGVWDSENAMCLFDLDVGYMGI